MQEISFNLEWAYHAMALDHRNNLSVLYYGNKTGTEIGVEIGSNINTSLRSVRLVENVILVASVVV